VATRVGRDATALGMLRRGCGGTPMVQAISRLSARHVVVVVLRRDFEHSFAARRPLMSETGERGIARERRCNDRSWAF
jgi:hypothetical protein